MFRSKAESVLNYSKACNNRKLPRLDQSSVEDNEIRADHYHNQVVIIHSKICLSVYANFTSVVYDESKEKCVDN